MRRMPCKFIDQNCCMVSGPRPRDGRIIIGRTSPWIIRESHDAEDIVEWDCRVAARHAALLLHLSNRVQIPNPRAAGVLRLAKKKRPELNRPQLERLKNWLT